MRLISALVRRLRRPREIIVGYEQRDLVDVVFRKTEAFVPTEPPVPEVAAASSVLDFGGGCGLHYKQANSPTVRWAVVETTGMVARASSLATDRLQFFTDISDAAAWLGSVDLMHSDGALQYVPEPGLTLKKLCGLGAHTMLWRRTFLSDGETSREIQSSYLGDNGPGRLAVKEKIVQYPRIRIPERDFLEAHEGYSLAERGPDWFRFVL